MRGVAATPELEADRRRKIAQALTDRGPNVRRLDDCEMCARLPDGPQVYCSARCRERAKGRRRYQRTKHQLLGRQPDTTNRMKGDG
jgi:hypothetical protein